MPLSVRDGVIDLLASDQLRVAELLADPVEAIRPFDVFSALPPPVQARRLPRFLRQALDPQSEAAESVRGRGVPARPTSLCPRRSRVLPSRRSATIRRRPARLAMCRRLASPPASWSVRRCFRSSRSTIRPIRRRRPLPPLAEPAPAEPRPFRLSLRPLRRPSSICCVPSAVSRSSRRVLLRPAHCRAARSFCPPVSPPRWACRCKLRRRPLTPGPRRRRFLLPPPTRSSLP